MFDQREIILIPFPYSDLTGSKQRPALIISNNKINKTQDRICCLITTNAHKDDLLIANSFFEDRKLPFKSFVKPHRIFTIDKRIIRKKISKINISFHNKIIKKINEFINLQSQFSVQE